MSQEIWETRTPGKKETLSHQDEARRRGTTEEAQCDPEKISSNEPEKISSNEPEGTELELGYVSVANADISLGVIIMSS